MSLSFAIILTIAIDNTVSVNVKAKDDPLSQLKAEMENLFNKAKDGKYKVMSNNKIVFVPKTFVKKAKQGKR